MANWEGARTLPDVLRTISAGWEPSTNVELVKLLDQALEPGTVQLLVAEFGGQEPVETRGASYEEWSGYDLKGGAINYEDWWKDGGREGIAESRLHADWSRTVTTFSRCYPLYLRIFKHLIADQKFAMSFASAYDQSLALVQAYLTRYDHITYPPNPKVSLRSPRGQLVRLLLADPPVPEDHPSVQDSVRRIAAEAIGAQFGGDDRAIDWYDRLLTIKESTDPAEYHFPASLKPHKRAMVHELAEKLGLKHYSDGMEIKSQKGKEDKKRAQRKGETVVERHVVVKNF